MPERHSFDYAVIRVVPRVEREEFINVGVILTCRAANFLEAQFELDEERLAAFAPEIEIHEIKLHMEVIQQICKGGDGAGHIGKLPRRARFDWLVAPRSTIIQTSAVHTGLCSDPQQTLARLVRDMVSTRSEPL